MEPESDRRVDSRLRDFLDTLNEAQREFFSTVWDLQVETADQVRRVARRTVILTLGIPILVAVGWVANEETRQDIVVRLCERSNAIAQANLDFLEYDVKAEREVLEKARERFVIEPDCEDFTRDAVSPSALVSP